jgi:hypothetical protein
MAGIMVLAVIAVVAAVLVVLGPGSGESASDSSGTAAAPTAPDMPLIAPPGDPAQALEVQRRSDAAAAEALVGTWTPQLSAKKEGMVVDGRTYDAAAILADHRQLRAAHQDAILVWSDDYTSFRGQSFWITIVNRSFPSGGAANAWCQDAGFGPDDCYAKRLSRTGNSAAHTAMRTDSGSSASTSRSGSGGAGSSSSGDPFGCLAERAAQERSYDTANPMSNAELRCNYNYGPTLPSTPEQCWLADYDRTHGGGPPDERGQREFAEGCSPFGY